MARVTPRAIGFDLGDTLIEYEGIPLNWEAYYPQALTNLAAVQGFQLNSALLDQGCEILRRANTRLYPREYEITFATLLAELQECFGLYESTECDELACAHAFFEIFRQKLRCFPEVSDVLGTLRAQEIPTGIYTDVPYGMPASLVQNDLFSTGLDGAVDVFLTSTDTGFRKPTVKTLQTLAARLSCPPEKLLYVGNERKDIQVAKAVGCTAVLIDRAHQGYDWGQEYTISSLTELLSLSCG